MEWCCHSIPLKATPADFKQAQELWKVLKRYPNQQEHLAHNIAAHAAGADAAIQDRVFAYFGKVSQDLADAIKKEVLELSPKKISVNETRKALI